MSNDERVKALNKKLNISLVYSDTLENKRTAKPDRTKLKALAAKIRKNLEETSVEASAHPHARI